MKKKKLKTKTAVAKRFRVTSTGKVMRRRQHGRHLRIKKSKSQKTRYKRTDVVKGKIAKKIKKMIGKKK